MRMQLLYGPLHWFCSLQYHTSDADGALRVQINRFWFWGAFGDVLLKAFYWAQGILGPGEHKTSSFPWNVITPHPHFTMTPSASWFYHLLRFLVEKWGRVGKHATCSFYNTSPLKRHPWVQITFYQKWHLFTYLTVLVCFPLKGSELMESRG